MFNNYGKMITSVRFIKKRPRKSPRICNRRNRYINRSVRERGAVYACWNAGIEYTQVEVINGSVNRVSTEVLIVIVVPRRMVTI